jgi:hypothetical protein
VCRGDANPDRALAELEGPLAVHTIRIQYRASRSTSWPSFSLRIQPSNAT